MMFYPRSRMTRFVLLFEGRTGSSYLISSLNAHPRVLALEEELRRFKAEGHAAQARWVEQALRLPLLGRRLSRGFKTKLRDIAEPQRFAELLRQQQVRILYMRRRNRIKTVVSALRSRMLKEKTNQYNAYRPEERLGPVEIPLDQFDRLLIQRERLDAELDAFVEGLGLPTLPLFYEDILLDEDGLLRRLYAFLGVPPRRTRGVSFKNTSDDLRQSVLNFDALRAAYADTAYAAMFDEVLVEEADA
ncbi:hypothetical protein QVG61_01765 [Thiohalobacter sp. IOR34]|uniref:hypothetical protein n=1 Tax=Thiohalobacter sp. IOR34 TaxID=3057176 RepID=UPI0025B19AC0|nr:hypothetical protein [Thiohalobacter sp. IOR34]WJW75841.1 hypothetical protein QVG61_01765 [Thiohalobacter sp. IOR34]